MSCPAAAHSSSDTYPSSSVSKTTALPRSFLLRAVATINKRTKPKANTNKQPSAPERDIPMNTSTSMPISHSILNIIQKHISKMISKQKSSAMLKPSHTTLNLRGGINSVPARPHSPMSSSKLCHGSRSNASSAGEFNEKLCASACSRLTQSGVEPSIHS